MSERQALRVMQMSASALRYRPRPDGNVALRERIVAMAQRHRRYGAPMIYLKLRQAGLRVNHKRVERLYALEALQVRRRRRKKIAPADRLPLIRPAAANAVWSMDFVFDRIATGRALKCLAIVDDATHEAVAVIPEHAIGGDHLARLLDAVCAIRGQPAIIRTDNGKEFTGRAMLTALRARANPSWQAFTRSPYRTRESGFTASAGAIRGALKRRWIPNCEMGRGTTAHGGRGEQRLHSAVAAGTTFAERRCGVVRA